MQKSKAKAKSVSFALHVKLPCHKVTILGIVV